MKQLETLASEVLHIEASRVISIDDGSPFFETCLLSRIHVDEVRRRMCELDPLRGITDIGSRASNVGYIAKRGIGWMCGVLGHRQDTNPETFVKYAHRLTVEIGERIRTGTFSLVEYFPASGSATVITLKDWLDTWLNTQRIESSTSDGYASAARFWSGAVCDAKQNTMGPMTLRALKHSHILTAIANRPDLSGKTINNYVSVLRDALALAAIDKTSARSGERTGRRCSSAWALVIDARTTCGTATLRQC